MPNAHARVLELVGRVSGLLELDEFCHGLFAALQATLPSDYVSLNQVASEPEGNWSIVQPSLSEAHHASFYRLALQNPLAERFLRTRDGRPQRLSDIVTPAQFHATEIYREFYAPLLIEHQIAFTLPSDDQHILAIALSRCRTDYTDPERDLLALARPHLIQAYRSVLEYGNRPVSQGPEERTLVALGLTPTQARVLRLIALGRSTTDIADELRVAPRTVHKHLQRTYRKLGVKDRSDAARRAWEATSV